MTQRKSRAAPKRKCMRCGEVKLKRAFPGSYKRVCNACARCHCGKLMPDPRLKACSRECVNARRAARQKKVGCVACGLPKPRNFENFHVDERDENGNVVRWDPWCRPCRRAYQRQLYQGKPEVREAALRRARERAARERQRMQNDPEFAAKVRADRARWARTYREGRKQRDQRDRPPPAPKTRSKVAVAPLMAHLTGPSLRRPGENLEDLCRRLGINSRTLRRWQTGEIAEICTPTVDAILTKTHLNWHDVWSEETEAA